MNILLALAALWVFAKLLVVIDNARVWRMAHSCDSLERRMAYEMKRERDGKEQLRRRRSDRRSRNIDQACRRLARM